MVAESKRLSKLKNSFRVVQIRVTICKSKVDCVDLKCLSWAINLFTSFLHCGRIMSVNRGEMSKFRILCIEDNPDTQRMLTFILARAGYEVITADDGPQGIQKARAWRPALILVDMMMPKMSGAETIAKLREIEIIKDIPILVLSAYKEQALIDEALAAGADDYLIKTVLPDDLTDVIDRCLEIGTAVLTKKATRIKVHEEDQDQDSAKETAEE